MSDYCVSAEAEYFADVALLRIVVEVVGMRNISPCVDNNMSVLLAIGFTDSY
jgi:hypothetical protein